ncbi:MAG: LuxR family transcriptional regulator [Chlorogloeopsis fritschii C42_A2020_084]|uniref:LuxR C-terminal-related transcriptional regulator n=1 Tax=Chlorogloeopsis fritschii TaxID=1124 RepID=UPI0019FD8C4E|nr:LuxR C-terminal-related transcriptional regulator [Chlorogloeopsis fritschii]MBF2007033.1 LuxR family transcriptional regulator [Chlorogloeopsis fritschii C42_A2020_084]
MSESFHALIHKIAIARDEFQLRLHYMDAVGKLFACQHWSIYLHDSQGQRTTIDIKGLPDSFIDYYQSVGAVIDPVMQYVIENHAPAHEQVIFTEAAWKQSRLYQSGCGKKYDHEHIMTGPIVGQGKLIGTVHFARTSGIPAFNTVDLLHLSALCAHFSAQLAFLRTQQEFRRSQQATCLTPRELQIASLVANGLTNAEIAAELWISQNTVKQTLKRIFQKLDVSARAEMVAKLQLFC